MHKILKVKNLFAIAGFIILLAFIQAQQLSANNNVTPLPPGTVVFGPETFIRQEGEPKIINRTFEVENSSGTFAVLIENGQNGENLVSSAVIRLNGSEVLGTKDFSQKFFNFAQDVSLQENNELEIKMRSNPGSLLTVTILKLVPNSTINNSKADFNGGNYGEFIHVTWSPASDASEFVLFKSLSLDGPFVEDFRLPASAGTEGVDITPDARLKTLCYRLEAQDAQGRVVRNYKPICVPKFIELASHELPGLFQRIVPDQMCLTDVQFEDTTTMSLSDIRAFLVKNGSFLHSVIPDVDGVNIDPPQVIFNAAQEFNVNPQIILTTLQKEHRAINSKTRLEKDKLEVIMGFDTSNPTTIRQQIRDGTAQFRLDFNKLSNDIPTISGWLVDSTKASEDPVDVTPASQTVALLFSYTPWVGENWSEFGGRIGKGGNGLFCAVWASFDFPIPSFAEEVFIYFGNGGLRPEQFGTAAAFNTLVARYENQGFPTTYNDVFPADLVPFRLVILVAPGANDDSGANFFTTGQVSAFISFLQQGGRLVVMGDNSGDFGINTVNDLLAELNLDIRQNADAVTLNMDADPPLTDVTPTPLTAGVASIDFSRASSLTLIGPNAISLIRVQAGLPNAGATVMALQEVNGGDIVVIGDTQGLDDFAFADPAGDGFGDAFQFADNLVEVP